MERADSNRPARAGADKSKNPGGRRRGFLIHGILLNIIGLGALVAIGSNGGIARFVSASAYMMLMTGAGAIAGVGAAGPILNWALAGFTR
jgi:hypothetical protein